MLLKCFGPTYRPTTTTTFSNSFVAASGEFTIIHWTSSRPSSWERRIFFWIWFRRLLHATSQPLTRIAICIV